MNPQKNLIAKCGRASGKLTTSQLAMIDRINAELEAEDPEPETYAPNLNVSSLAMHIRIINFNLWKVSK